MITAGRRGVDSPNLSACNYWCAWDLSATGHMGDLTTARNYTSPTWAAAGTRFFPNPHSDRGGRKGGVSSLLEWATPIARAGNPRERPRPDRVQPAAT
jgi:hypothetical protein